MMKDFVRQYSSRVATTSDFKQVVENHFGRSMAWFFDQWVYGTGIPVYHVEHDISVVEGGYVLTVIVRQSDVAENFQMPLPILVHFKNGYAAVFVQVTGSEPVVKQFRLPLKPQKIEINPWNAVLCETTK
jgi:aminopeptidase N